MRSDAEGFLYPQIDESLCVDCGLCRSVCPVNSRPQRANTNKTVYAARNKDDAVRASSSSGGLFALLAQQIISHNGAVYGAAFDETFRLVHQRTEADFAPMQTSKYVQSCIGDAFAQVEMDLKNEKAVLFTGTPCQVAGLHNYLIRKQANTDNLYLVDLICHGVPSPLVWEKYLKSISSGKAVKSVNFRDKSHSWGGFSLAVSFADGTQYKALANEDSYFKGFFANMILRSSCHACAQKTVDRVSDLTIADCWGIDNFLPEINDGKGTSAVIVHTKKGAQILQNIRPEMEICEVPLEKVLRYNRAMTESVHPHPRRKKFFALLQGGAAVAPTIEQLLKPTFKERLKKIEVSINRCGRKILKKII